MTNEQENQLDHYMCDDCLEVDDGASVGGANVDDSLPTSTDQVRFL